MSSATTITSFRCTICQRSFAPEDGGHCRRCGRLLCRQHLVYEGAQALCVDCQPPVSFSSRTDEASRRKIWAGIAASVAGGLAGALIGGSLGYAVLGAALGELIVLTFLHTRKA